MPRKARLDAAGALHHVIARVIEQRTIFVDSRDKGDVLKKLNKLPAAISPIPHLFLHFHPISYILQWRI